MTSAGLSTGFQQFLRGIESSPESRGPADWLTTNTKPLEFLDGRLTLSVPEGFEIQAPGLAPQRELRSGRERLCPPWSDWLSTQCYISW